MWQEPVSWEGLLEENKRDPWKDRVQKAALDREAR